MANKRMFSLTVIDTDAFMEMPLSTQALYFHLCMRADDDGFVSSPKKISRAIGTNDDDLKVLLAKQFILTFEDGVIVIKHWRMHNTISRNRYFETSYVDHKKMLKLKPNNSYTLGDGEEIDDRKFIESRQRQTNVDAQKTHKRRTKDAQKTCTEKNRIEENSIVENSIEKNSKEENSIDNNTQGTKSPTRKRFIPPTVDEVKEYCEQRNNNVNPDHFVNYYTSNGWKVGKNSMKDWKAAVRTWEQNGYNSKSTNKKAEELNDFYKMTSDWAKEGEEDG